MVDFGVPFWPPGGVHEVTFCSLFGPGGGLGPNWGPGALKSHFLVEFYSKFITFWSMFGQFSVDLLDRLKVAFRSHGRSFVRSLVRPLVRLFVRSFVRYDGSFVSVFLGRARELRPRANLGGNVSRAWGGTALHKSCVEVGTRP